MKTTRHLIDLLSSATVTEAGENFVSVQPMGIKRDVRMGIFEHPPSSIKFPKLKLGSQPVLTFGCGLKDSCWQHIRTKVYFAIKLCDERGRQHSLFQMGLAPHRKRKDCQWHDHQVSLSAFEGQEVQLIFTTYVRWKGDTAWCWAGWADPKIEHIESKNIVPLKKETSKRHILLITSDAFRADMLACYGHPFIKTPHLDQFAREGVRFSHARAQSSTTFGSYISLLTSLYSTQHGIHTEWGSLPSHIMTLPRYLKQHGYHTVIAPSEYELYQEERGLIHLFEETIPCLALPAQHGAITTRQVINWLDQRVDSPFFLWLQYFDTHPPYSPEEPFRSMYYQGDPTHSERRHRPECIAKIRGVEAIEELDYAFEILSKGLIPEALCARLLAVVKVFRGESLTGPDLAEHLLALGPEARMQMSLLDFAVWLERQVKVLLSGEEAPALLKWFRETRQRLLIIESGIISWLDGVIDFRYPVAQYLSSVSYLDHQIGLLIQALKERDLYDHTTIIVTSPHGESLGENEYYFDHHHLSEVVLRIPLLIKPDKHTVYPAGATINGIFDSIDLFPTLIEAFGLPSLESLSGTSRWKQICTGHDIPPHNSIAIDYNQAAIALVSESFLYFKIIKEGFLHPESCWKKYIKKGRALYHFTDTIHYRDDVIMKYHDVANRMEQQLQQIL